MINSFIASIMNIYADIYVQQNVQDKSSGAIAREWVYDKTVPCKVEPVKVSATSNSNGSKEFAQSSINVYSEKLQLKIKTLEMLSRRWRIHSIKTSDGNQVFTEIDRYGNPDSIFEVVSSHTVLDPFGKISYYESTLQRVPVQNNDKNIRQ